MPDRQVPTEARERTVVEDGGHEALVLHHGYSAAIADRHASRLLTAVLQREQAEVGQVGDGLPGGVDAEDAARLLGMVVERGVVEIVAEGHLVSLPGQATATATSPTIIARDDGGRWRVYMARSRASRLARPRVRSSRLWTCVDNDGASAGLCGRRSGGLA